MNSFFGDTIRKDVNYKHEFKTGRWIKNEYVDRVEQNHEMRNGGFF